MIFSLLCRIQVEARHNVKQHYGSYKDQREADFARDYSLYLKLSCQPPSKKDKYHYWWSHGIFEKFECLPDKPALVPIYKQLQLELQTIRCKGKPKDKKLVQFGEAARNRIKEMMPDFRDARRNDETMGKVCHAKLVVTEQLADKDWVLLREFMKTCPKWSFMDIILARYCTEGLSSEQDYQGYGHHATSAPQEVNISAAKTLVLEQFADEDWLMLGEFVSIVGIQCIMFILCNYLSDVHHLTPVHPQERNSGYATFDHAQNSTAGEASNTDDQVLMDQSSENVDSALKPCRINPKDYPFISREDDVWWCKDLE